MFTFCDVLHETKQKMQSLKSAEYGLETILKFSSHEINVNLGIILKEIPQSSSWQATIVW